MIAAAGLPWHVTRLGARAEYRFAPQPPRNGGESAAAGDEELERFLHLYALNRGVLITPFHNMALVSPATSEADVDRHTRGLRGRARRARRDVADVRLETVVKRFDGVVAVDGITLEIPSGSFFALLGPSGCGKTTTLRMIGGFEEPDEGAIYLGDRDVVGLPPYRRDVNTVFQSYALFPHLSIFDNVAFGLRRKGVDKTQVKGRRRRDAAAGRARGPRLAPAAPALRRPAAARRARARAREPAAGAAARRAARRARPEAAQADAARAEGDPARPRAHLRPRHARPGGGDDDGRRDRGDEPRPDRAARARRPSSTSGRRPRSSPASSASPTCSTARSRARVASGSTRATRSPPTPASAPAASPSASARRRSGSARPARATTASPAPSRRPPTSASPRSTWSRPAPAR